MSAVKVKLCGLRRPEEIAFANEAGPDCVGFVFAPKSRPGSDGRDGEIPPRKTK